MAIKLPRQRIMLRGHDQQREVEAIIVAARVAVHPTWNGGGFTISDPVTGLAYYRGWNLTQSAALRKARRFVAEFGSNPLKGMAMKGDEVIRKPPRADEMRDWFSLR